MNTFSAGAMIRFGWETFKKRPWFFVGIQVIIVAVGSIASQMSGQFDKGYAGSALILALAGFFVGTVIHLFLRMGTISLALKANESVDALKVEDLWAPAQFWKYLLTSIVVGLIFVFGLLLLIVPGIMWGLRYMFAQYLVVDRGLGLEAALSESARITDGHKWELFLMVIMIIGINIAGLLALVVGLLVSLPVTMLTIAHAYRTLEHAAGEIVPVPAV